MTRTLVAVTALALLIAPRATAQHAGHPFGARAPRLSPDAARTARLLPTFVPVAGPQDVELGVELNALFELRFDRLRNLRCTAGDVVQATSACRSGFTPPRLEPQVSLRSGGIVGERVHVNVDYDSEREFDASNNVQVYYQGRQGEALRRVQVGNVTFRPPESRFITGGVPANNFGVQFEGRLGALDFGAIAAQQKGNVVRGRMFTIGDRTLRPVDRELADRDYEPLRFFFVVDPALLPGYPAVDVLSLPIAGLPPSARPAQVRIYRRRGALSRAAAEQNLTGIEAVAVRTDSPQRAGPFAWEVLIEGRDYYLDPSGTWFALANRLDQDDYLAVSYVTLAGDTVGTFPAASATARADTLRLIHEPRRGATVPTFRYEMRNAYRVGSVDDVVRETVRARLIVAESERPTAGAATFLSQLGLALESDATTFDQYNRLFPRQRDPGGGTPLRDYFIVFPHLTPFADASLAPPFRADSLYRTPSHLLRTQGPTPLHRMRLRYDAAGGDDRGRLFLGGFQIREGSERLSVGGRQLVRDTDYTINYETGQVTFTRPDSLFAAPTQVVAQYEENQAFAIAPTAVYGASARYDLGERGAITALALLQSERTTFNRPPLGFEPSSNFVGGVSGNFRFEPQRLTRWLDALPLVRTGAPSFIALDAEMAASRPSPNQLGVAYVETFEGEAGAFLQLEEGAWGFGSRPSSAHGLAGRGVDPVTGFRDDDAVQLTWQSLIRGRDGRIVQLRSQDVDPDIRLQGTGQQSERVLWMALHPDTLGGLADPGTGRARWLLPRTPGPRWRSITQPLSATGLDLSRVEFLEFWVLEDPGRQARNAGATLVLDFGTVYEDAVDLVPTSFRRPAPGDTSYAGRRRIGEGRLDSERDPLTSAFNAALNDNGILGAVADTIRDADADSLVRDLALCRSELASGLAVHDWGSLLSRCTRRNGRADTEDLDNDQRLDTLVAASQEHHFRFVFPVGDDRYFVRDGGQVPGTGQWRLYRVPFRTDTVQVGLPDVRQVRALRLTVVAPAVAGPESTLTFALARLRLVGAPWVKRAATPIAGLSGGRGEGHGEVVASVVSTQNRSDLGYEPPPGVTDQGESRAGAFQIGTQQINEHSLRIIGSGVRPGERAEAFLRFPEGERNFLGYRELRVWARGRGPGWDANELSFFIKVAQDEDNFYLYRAGARTTTWEPEVVVDFRRWLALRAQVEGRYLRGEPPLGAAGCGGDSLAYVACDGPYVVHVRNPGIAPPNLARVQELAAGFIRDAGLAADSIEVWVDDIRLTGAVDDAGYAGAVNVRLVAADVAEVAVGLARRDANFRQMGEVPGYVGENELTVAATVRLERFGLERLGIMAPLTIKHDRSSQDPFYLNRTDVRTEDLGGFRQPRQGGTTYGLQLRRTRHGTLWWQRAFVDNISVTAVLSSGSTATEYSRSSRRASNLRGDYAAAPGDVSFRYLPGFLARVLDALPDFIGGAEFARGLREGRLRVTPARLSFTSALARAEDERFTFRRPVDDPLDTLPPVQGTSASWRNTARVGLRPFRSLDMGVELTSGRDLNDYGDSTTIGIVAKQSSGSVLGADVGFERFRSVGTRLAWSPPLLSWLRPRFSARSDFALHRDPEARVPERERGDSTGEFRLPTAFMAFGATDMAAVLDLPRALRGLLGDSAPRALVQLVGPVDVSRRIERRGQFDRAGFDPSLGFQLGLRDDVSYRSHEGRPAASAMESVLDRVGSVLRLPLGLSVTGAYAERRGLVWTLRGSRQQEQVVTETDWPNVSARWMWSRPGAGDGLLSSVSATASLRHREGEVLHLPLEGAGEAIRSENEVRSAPVALGIGWASRVTTSLSYGNESSRTGRAGTVTLSDREFAGADAGFSFRFPSDLVALRSDVRTSLRYLYARTTGCVQRAAAEPCVPVSDSRRREVNVSFDTDLPPDLAAGLSIAYVRTEDGHVNRKFSHLVVTASLRLTLVAGGVRR